MAQINRRIQFQTPKTVYISCFLYRTQIVPPPPHRTSSTPSICEQSTQQQKRKHQQLFLKIHISHFHMCVCVCVKTLSLSRTQQISHLTKHTANIIRPSRRTSIGMSMMVMKLLTTHTHRTRLLPLLLRLLWLLDGRTHGIGGRNTRGCCSRTTTGRTGQMIRRMGHLFSGVDFGHATDPSTPEFGILVAVAPAVDGTLDETAFAAQTGIEFGESPTDGVAFGFVEQPVSPVLIFAAAGARVDTVFVLEFRIQALDIDGFHIASDGVFHLDPVTRVFESDPLYTVVVLSNNERSRGWDWSGCCIGIHSACRTWRALVHGVSVRWRTRRSSIRIEWSGWWSLQASRIEWSRNGRRFQLWSR